MVLGHFMLVYVFIWNGSFFFFVPVVLYLLDSVGLFLSSILFTHSYCSCFAHLIEPWKRYICWRFFRYQLHVRIVHKHISSVQLLHSSEFFWFVFSIFCFFFLLVGYIPDGTNAKFNEKLFYHRLLIFQVRFSQIFFCFVQTAQVYSLPVFILTTS